MPANLTPEYRKADEWYRSATTNEEKLLALEQMLRVIPKHKGTEHMRADLKRKLSHLKEAATQKKRGGGVDIFHVPPGGAGQVVLIGTPNCGKSSILAALTKAKVHVADFPFATHAPVPGMMHYENVQIQLVDMPPITEQYSAPGQVGTYRNCDLIGIVIDMSDDVEEQMLISLDFMETRKLLTDEQTPQCDEHGNSLGKKAFVICTKADVASAGAMEKLKAMTDRQFEYITISPERGDGMEEFARKVFELLQIIRVYAKPPGKPVDMKDPFTLPIGSTVQDLAVVIHRQLAEKLKSAKIWGTGVYDGQNVQLHHILHDKDVVELYFG